jgi:hypothetical protein
MTAPPPRPGSSAPDAENWTTAPPQGPTAATPADVRSDRATAPRSAGTSPHGPADASQRRHNGPTPATGPAPDVSNLTAPPYGPPNGAPQPTMPPYGAAQGAPGPSAPKYGRATGTPATGGPSTGGPSTGGPSTGGGPASPGSDPDANATVSFAARHRIPSGPAMAPPATPYGLDTDAAEDALERTVMDVLEPETGTALTVAHRAEEPPLSAGESTTPPLTPDAILPPGTIPEAPTDPDREPEMDATRPTPQIGSGEPGPHSGGPRGPRRPWSGRPGAAGSNGALLIGAGALAALLLGGGGVIAYSTVSDDAPKRHPAAPPTHASQPLPTPSPAAPSPTRSSTKPKPKPTPIDIRDEKKDPKPLSVTEVFPDSRIKVAGHTFVLMKTVPNDHCNLTANGPFGDELTRQHCRRVVRATFVSDDKKIAVTTGIAAMPTDAAAAAAMKAQDAPHYKWFRGMKASDAPKIDQPGGYAVSLQRGRYIIYAYVMYADAHKPKPDDTTLRDVGHGFGDTTSKPIDARAKG